MGLLQNILDQIESINPSSVSFPLDEITEHQEVVGIAGDSITRIWGFLQQIRDEFANNPQSSTKAMVQIVELYLTETLREQFPAPNGQQVIGIGPNGQIYWARYYARNSQALNDIINSGSAFFLHIAA